MYRFYTGVRRKKFFYSPPHRGKETLYNLKEINHGQKLCVSMIKEVRRFIERKNVNCDFPGC